MNVQPIRSTEECLKDFFQKYGRVKKLADFALVSIDTEIDWRLHGTVPNGETLIRVRYFLWLIGYRITEVEELSPELQILGKCVAFGESSINALEIETNMTSSHLYRYLKAKLEPGPEKKALFKKIAERHERLLKEQIDIWRPVILEAIKDAEAKIDRSRALKKEATELDPTSELDPIEEFRQLCKSVREYAQKLLNGTREERVKMRKIMMDMKDPELQKTIKTLSQLTNEKGEI